MKGSLGPTLEEALYPPLPLNYLPPFFKLYLHFPDHAAHRQIAFHSKNLRNLFMLHPSHFPAQIHRSRTSLVSLFPSTAH